MKKKILLITHSANITGGAEDDFQRIISSLSSNPNNIITILCPLGQRYSIYSKYAAETFDYKIGWFPVVKDKIRNYIRYFAVGLIQILQIMKIISGRKYDIAIFNVSVLFLPIFYIKLRKVKSIVFIRETLTPLSLRRYYYKLLSRIGDHFVGVSKFNIQDFEALTDNKNTTLLYSSIEKIEDHKKDNDQELENNINSQIYSDLKNSLYFKILFNGNICNRKNQLFALETLDYMVNSLNIRDIKMFFTGDYESDQMYYDKIKKLIAEKDLSNYAFFLGAVKKSTIYKLYESIDLSLILSFSEGMPLVLVESFAYKKPLISTNVGGICEVIDNNVNGYLLDNYDSLELSNKILKLKNDKTLYNKISTNCYNTFLEKFDLESNMNVLNSLIENLIKN